MSASDLGLPKLEHVDWDVLDYIGWIHPGGHHGYVVLPVQGEPKGMMLRRTLGSAAQTVTHMCSWCHHVYRGRGTAMFSAYVAGSDQRRIIGDHLCRHLDCSLRIRNLTGDPPAYLPETLGLLRRIDRLENAVSRFMSRANVLQSQEG